MAIIVSFDTTTLEGLVTTLSNASNSSSQAEGAAAASIRNNEYAVAQHLSTSADMLAKKATKDAALAALNAYIASII